ncbi:Spx/MgsR family RNA polymerase-binding regulatory protein [Metallibacterium sp.]
MSYALYGLDKCDTCAKARRWLDRHDVTYRFIDYRAQRPEPDTLRDWARQIGGWDKLVNKGGPTWRNLLPQRKSPASDAEWTLLIREHPPLLRRPLVLRDAALLGVGFNERQFAGWFAGAAPKPPPRAAG